MTKDRTRRREEARRQDLVRKLEDLAEYTRKRAPGFFRGFSGGFFVQEASPVLAFCLPATIALHPLFFGRSRRDQMFILLHEVEHLRRDHAGVMMKMMDKRPRGCDEEVWMQAMAVGVDMEVNTYLRDKLGYLAWGAACPGAYHFKSVPHRADARAYARTVASNPEWVQIIRRVYLANNAPLPKKPAAFPSGATEGKRPSQAFGNTVRICRYRNDIKRRRHDRMDQHIAGLDPKLMALLQRAARENRKLMGGFQGLTQIDAQTPALACCSSGEVYVNPDLFQRCRRDQVFILLHEVAHIHRDHAALEIKLQKKRPRVCDSDLWDNAISAGMDMEINAALQKRLGYLARSALCPGVFPFRNIPRLPNALAYAKAIVATPKLAGITSALDACRDTPFLDPSERPAFPKRLKETSFPEKFPHAAFLSL